ncbi:MAG TPA: hypothetical protein PKJ99_12855 [Thermoanaerobaculales bacterium]|nr:hypothetical protein [Thermoanaerobaculales bacterium]HPA80216.1 hypothetical protein [Thermoanaerobaculales bacterium]HQL30452.1 hypothetical protein [Thermoanaerobaculales bacterium]HQN96593.1 hypothetical protein [Thermoanaerobaculales bacterium]HQP44448.1 hypothetical protein [Thermoanaerobaculales bacterium]
MKEPPRLGLLAFLLAAVGLLGLLATLPPTGFFSADSGPKYWQCLAFAEGEGSPRGFDYPARGLDPELHHIPPFTAPVGDRLASIYPVLFPLLAAVPEAAAGDRALRLLPWLAAILAAWATGRLASALRGEAVTWPAAAAALAATPLAFYAIAFWEHSLASAMVVVGLLVVVEGERGRARVAWRWLVLGVLVGLGAWVRTEAAFLVPLLVAAAAWRGGPARLRCALAFAGGCAAGLACGAAVQSAALGTWLPMHVTYHAASTFRAHELLSPRLASLAHFVAPDWSCGLGAAVWLAALAMNLTRAGSRSRAGRILGVAAVAVAVGAATVVPAVRWLAGARPTDAFPATAPATTWVVLSALPLLLWGQPRAATGDKRRLMVAAAAAWSIFAVFVARPVHSFEWGSRLFLTAVLLLLAVTASLRVAGGPWRRLRRAAVVAAVATAIAVQGLGLVLLRHGATTHHRIGAAVLAFSGQGEPVVSDSYMVPLISGRGWWQRRFLYVTGRPGLELLAASFAKGGVARWTYATLERPPAGLLEGGGELVGSDGSRWRPRLAEDREVGSERLRLLRFERRWPRRAEAAKAAP